MLKVIVTLACLFAFMQSCTALRQPPKHPNAGHSNLSLKPGSFDKIFIIQFENQPFMFVKNDPNFAYYSKQGVNLTNYYGCTHPSQPNYWCQVAGDHWWIFSDFDFNLNHTNLVDLMEAKGISWKGYMEDLPSTECYSGTKSGPYYRKHNPFISFDNIRNNPQRCAKIVNAKQLDDDLSSNQLPQYSYYTPNINNDGHDTGLAYAGKFLKAFLEPRLPLFPNGTLIIITWDEDNYLENNHISTIALGSMVKPGTSDNTPYNHYSLLKSVEDNWELGNLGRNDVGSNSYQFLKP